MTRRRGQAVVDALVALGLAGVAAALLAATAVATARGLDAAIAAGHGLTLAQSRLDRLRAAPAADGSTSVTVDGGGTWTVDWTTTGGRGQARTLTVAAHGPGRRRDRTTRVLP